MDLLNRAYNRLELLAIDADSVLSAIRRRWCSRVCRRRANGGGGGIGLSSSGPIPGRGITLPVERVPILLPRCGPTEQGVNADFGERGGSAVPDALSTWAVPWRVPPWRRLRSAR